MHSDNQRIMGHMEFNSRLLLLGQNTQYLQVKGGKVWFSSQFEEVSIHTQLDTKQNGMEKEK